MRAKIDALGGAAVAPTPAPPAAPPAPATGSYVPGAKISPDLRAEIDRALDVVTVDFGGGSGHAKAYTFATLILEQNVRRIVEIGVYRGRSLLPAASVLSAVGGGLVVGIAPLLGVAGLLRARVDHQREAVSVVAPVIHRRRGGQ